MPRDLDGLADVVVLTVKTALGPVLERLAVLDARLALAAGAEESISTLRDRIVALETKAVVPSPPEINLDAVLAPVRERLVVAETTMATLPVLELTVTNLRDRVVASETKAAMPRPPEVNLDAAFAPVLERLAVAETTLATLPTTERTKALMTVNPVPPDPLMGELRDRVVVMEHAAEAVRAGMIGLDGSIQKLCEMRDRFVSVETKVGMPPPAPDLGDVRDRLVALETLAVGPSAAILTTSIEHLKSRQAYLEGRVHDDALAKAIAAVSERVAVMEVRAQVPGPPGKDGKDGKDGADGLGFDDLKAVQQDDRSFTIKAIRGDRVQDIGTATFPVQIQRGVYIEGKSYDRGDVVTWAGSQWYCNEDTITKPGDGSKAWTLIVKRGRDGRDGRDAPGAVPVVSVGRG